MENPVSISNLNDFIFCPASIYFHALDIETESLMYQDDCQINGSAAHEKSDSGRYSDRKNVLQAISVYCEKYNLLGKIDTFDSDTGILTERKKKITTIYDGYVFQIYAQYFALVEMGFTVNTLRLYSMSDNKAHNVLLPQNNQEMFEKFEALLNDMSVFRLNGFKQQNRQKCERCIYETLCSFSALKG